MKNATEIEVMNDPAKITKKDVPKSVWHEITSGKEELQKIIILLTEFDERTGRFKRYGDQESHWMRKAAGVCSPDELRIFVRDLGSWLYQVTVRISSSSGHLQTTWLHEDGIRAERETLGAEHPVQNIVCLTDLFQKHGVTFASPDEFGLDGKISRIHRDRKLGSELNVDSANGSAASPIESNTDPHSD